MPLMYWTRERIFDAFATWEQEYGSLPSWKDWLHARNGRRLKIHPTSRTVAKAFGSWENALAEYAKPKKRWKIWSQEEIIESFQRWAEEQGHPPTYSDVSRANHGGLLPSMTSIHSRFGTFRAAMEAAGLRILPKGVTYKSMNRFRPLPRRGDDDAT